MISATDRVLSLAAIVAAIAAVVVAVYEARIAREHQRVSVWPYLIQYNSHVPGGEYTRSVENVGLGPALVRSVQMRVDGQEKRAWNDVIFALIGEREPELIYSSLSRGLVLLPGTTRRALWLPPGERATRFWSAVQTERLSVRVCYCSLYQECWISDSREEEPQRVDVCPADPEAEFLQ